MNKEKWNSSFCVLVLLTSTFALPPVPIPRKSPEFTIYESPGKTELLSSFRGKVVVLEFLFMKSEHCLRVAKTLNKLHSELGARGFQPVGVTFDPPNGPSTGGQFVALMVDYFKLTYPVGYSEKADVDSYLGRSGKEMLNIPQIVVIDRAGTIRAASGGVGGDPKLEDENSLRTLIDSLLKESASGGASKK
jgi:peroxiredoxin